MCGGYLEICYISLQLAILKSLRKRGTGLGCTVRIHPIDHNKRIVSNK